MGQRQLSDLKAFFNQIFRPQKLFAEKDAQLADLRGDWVRVHEALRFSQEAVAQRDAHLVELGAHWTKLLAEKDAELAQSREHWNEALRLGQKATDQKDAQLRLSHEALAQKGADLAILRGDWTTPEGRAYRTRLSELRARFPWVGVFGVPKSASTFVWAALARLLNAERLLFNVVDPQAPGIQLMHELDPIRMRNRELQHRSVVFRMHVPASQHTLFHIRDLLIPAVVCSRDLFDCLVSLREEMARQWSDRELMLVTRERGSHEVFMGTVPIQAIQHFMRIEPERQIDMLIELVVLWYLRFYQSWRNAQQQNPDMIHICRFEHLSTRTEGVLSDLLAFLNCPVDHAAISTVVSALMQNRAEANFNVGISGRGRQIMSGAQIDRVMSIARTVGAEDLVGGL
jgi:hypothetical protein